MKPIAPCNRHYLRAVCKHGNADIDNSYADNGKIGDNGNGNNNATDDNSNIKNGNGDAVSGSAQQHAYRHLTYDQW